MSQKDQSTISGRQIAAARVLIAMGQAELAAAASISVPTLKRMEASEGPATGMANNVRAVVGALEAAGLEFIPENGGGAGIRFRERKANAQANEGVRVQQLTTENDGGSQG